jgi:hypothetical protein
MVIIVVIIISFVVFFTPGIGGGGGAGEFSITINGQTYSREEVQAAADEIRLFYFLRSQQPPSNEAYNQLALQRLLVKRLTAQYGITVGNDSVVEWIRERIMGGSGSFGGMTYDQYVSSVLKTGGFSAKLFEEFVRTEVGSEILRSTIGSSGALVTPAEARAAFIRDNEKMPVELAYVANSNYLSRVTMNLEDITQFYSNRVAAYRSPERIQVSYVRLATSNYVAEAEQSLSADSGFEVLVEANYLQRSNLFVGVEIEAAKQQVRQEYIDQEAFKIAQRKAYDFVNSYYDLEPKTTEVLNAAAQKIGLSAQQAPPFGRSETPIGVGAGPEFVTAAWELSKDSAFSIPVTAPDGYYAICFEGKIPGSIQPFADVKDRVEKEFREDRARTLAQEAADAFYTAATNAVANGQSFTNLARLSGLITAGLPNLTLRTAAEIDLMDLPIPARQIPGMAYNQEPGTVSRPQFAAEGLVLLNAGKRSDPTAEEIELGMKDYVETMRNSRSMSAYGEWLVRQEALSGIQTSFRNSP